MQYETMKNLKIQGALGGGGHYSDFLRPLRPQSLASDLYRNSGTPTADNYMGRARVFEHGFSDKEVCVCE